MQCESEDESLTVVQELQREIERQANLIYQLRQDNVTLKSRLDSNSACQMCADHLHFIEKEWTLSEDCHPDKGEELDPRSMTPSETELYAANNGIRLTIRTHMPPTPSAGSWMDETESVTQSEYDETRTQYGNKSKDGKKSGTCRQKLPSLFRRSKTKHHRRKSSLRASQTQIQLAEVSNHSERDQPETDPNDIVSSSPSQEPSKVKPVEQNVEQTYHESLSRIGWTESSIGQKLALLKESYTQQRDVFDDDVRFMREVLKGQSRAPEMDIEVELLTLMKDFKGWKKQFKESAKDLHADIKKAANKKSAASLCRPAGNKAGAGHTASVTASIGKLFLRTATGDLESPKRMYSMP